MVLKYFVFVFALIVLVGVVGAECTDNDVTDEFSDGKNYYLKSNCTGSDNVTGTDECVNGNLSENFCETDVCVSELYTCPNGCENGACVELVSGDEPDESVIISLGPLTIVAVLPTDFLVEINSSKNISKYEWDFGDNSATTTSKSFVSHTYDSIGTYDVKITVTDYDKVVYSRVFSVEIASPKDAIEEILNDKSEDAENIRTQINNFEGFYKDSLNRYLAPDVLDRELAKLRADNANASTEDEYLVILEDLIDLEMPNSISVSKIADSISFYAEKDDVDLYVVKEIGGGDYNLSDEDAYIDAVIAWGQANIDIKMDFKTISANYDGWSGDIVNFFEIDVDEKNNINYDYYLILGSRNFNFDGDYGEETSGDYTYLKPDKKIVFSTSSDFDFTNLPAFISPAISELVISPGPGGGEPGGKKSNWGVFIAIIIGLILAGIIIYVVLQQWYKKKYEKHLFRNQNNLFNLVTYVEGAKKMGLKEKDIDDKLKKSGSGSEQREYALRKHAGRRTGMLELPVTKIISKLKKEETPPQGKIPSK